VAVVIVTPTGYVKVFANPTLPQESQWPPSGCLPKRRFRRSLHTPRRGTPSQGGFAGVLANDPSVIKSVSAGKVYAFKREQISDWGYQQDGKQFGSFTVCAMFKTMPADDVARYKRIMDLCVRLSKP
jgi:hypothetical protein